MITKEKLIKEFKSRNINAILIINNFTLTFFVENEESKKIVFDMLKIRHLNYFLLILIADISCKGLAILNVHNLTNEEVNEISFNLSKSIN